MDEIKEPTQDTSHVEDASEKAKESTSEQEPKTYTKESEEKAINDALSAAGRDAKSITDKATEVERNLTESKRILDETRAEREQRQKDIDEQERETVKHDPDALKSLEEKHRQRTEKAKLANEKEGLAAEKAAHESKVKDDLEQIKVFKRTQLAAEVAVAKGVNIDALLKLAKEDTREAMEATADLLPKKEVKPPLKTDSSTTIGGEQSQEQRLKDRYPTMK